jgi:hypothetical protein
LHIWLLSYIKILIRLYIFTYLLDLYLHKIKVNWSDVITYPALMTHSTKISTFVDLNPSSKNNNSYNLNNDDVNLDLLLSQGYHLISTTSKLLFLICIERTNDLIVPGQKTPPSLLDNLTF